MCNASINNNMGAQRLRAFFDEQTFCEIGAYIKRKNNADEFEGVTCGYGSVNGRLTFAFAQEPERLNGAFDELHAKKIRLLFDSAMKNGAPVVAFLDSVGAVVNEGASVLAAYGEIMKSAASASGVIPTVAVISGICGGSSAIFASMFDVVVTAGENAKMYLAPSDGATSASAGKKGLAAISAKDEASAIAAVKDILDCIPQNNNFGIYFDETDLNREVTVPFNAENRCDMPALISQISDDGKFVELFGDYDNSMITAFAKVGGTGVGIIANNTAVNSGKITDKGASKAAKLISFCDSFSIPLISLADTDGIDSNVSGITALMSEYISSTNAKITVYTGNAIGSSFNLMGSKSAGADIVYALEDATIATMLPESAVAFIWNDKVGTEKRDELEKQWKKQYASPVHAAECGEIDDIIKASEIRQRICSAIMMLSEKSCDICIRKHHNRTI